MDKPMKDLQREVSELLQQGQDGKLDFTTCITKVARKVLEQENCDLMLHTVIAGILACEDTSALGCVLHVLSLRILRLEDDVRVLRGELVKERVRGMNMGGAECGGTEHEGGAEHAE